MRPFHIAALATALARDDGVGPSRVPDDEPIVRDEELSWIITFPDAYGGDFTHHFWPIHEIGILSL